MSKLGYKVVRRHKKSYKKFLSLWQGRISGIGVTTYRYKRKTKPKFLHGPLYVCKTLEFAEFVGYALSKNNSYSIFECEYKESKHKRPWVWLGLSFYHGNKCCKLDDRNEILADWVILKKCVGIGIEGWKKED